MIYRVQKTSDYVPIKNSALRDSRLSFTARGLLAYLLSMPDNWTVRRAHLLTQGTEGRRRIASALKELETIGYLQRQQKQDAKGRWRTTETSIFEEPQDSSKTPINHRDTACGLTDNGATESGLLKKDLIKEKPKKESTPPQIEAIRSLTKRYPPKLIWPTLITACGVLNEVKLKACLTEWVLRGHNPTNYSWITDWYVKGIPPPQKKFLTHAEMNRGGTGRLVI